MPRHPLLLAPAGFGSARAPGTFDVGAYGGVCTGRAGGATVALGEPETVREAALGAQTGRGTVPGAAVAGGSLTASRLVHRQQVLPAPPGLIAGITFEGTK